MSELLRFLIKQFRKEIVWLLLISAVVNLLMLLPTIYMLQIFDRVMVSKSEVTLLVVSLIVVSLYGVQAVAEWIRARLTNAISIRMDQALATPVFEALFQHQLKGSLRNPLQAFSDLGAIRQWMTGPGLNGFLDGPWTPFYLAVMFMLHPVLGWLAIACLLFIIGLTILSTRLSRNLSDATVEEERDLNTFVHTKLRNAEVVEAHGMVQALRRRWWAKQVGFLANQARAEDVEERMTATTKQVRYGVNSLAIAAGAILVIEGELTMGAMIAAGLLMGRVTAPADALMSSWRGFHMAKSALTRVTDLLGAAPTHPSEATHSDSADWGSILLKDLAAWAPAPDETARRHDILQGINLEIETGQITLVMGPSGAGKSTLGKVLTGIWPHQSGEVWLGEQRLGTIYPEWMGKQVGYLPQSVELFTGSVAENIARLGRPNPDWVIQAAKAVGIHEFILRLPKGYDTVLGTAEGYLSGGQRQRLALARAFYGQPKLLVLDEPNSSLDTAGEKSLMAALVSARDQGANVVVISHRPHLIQVADRVLWLQSGKMGFWGPKAAFVEHIQKRQQLKQQANSP